MSEYYENLSVGDKVYVECYSGMGTGGESTITNIKTKFDEDTGEPYPVICCGDHEFHGKEGYALTPPTMYFITDEV